MIKGDITLVQADIIVNAANRIGYMGGWMGKHFKCNGVAESIQYVTKGEVEKEAIRIALQNKLRPGDIFVTSSGNLRAKYIIHAITMWLPGMFSNYKTIEKLLPKIIEQARRLSVKTVAIPFLGAGTGRLSQKRVLTLYENHFKNISDMEIIIVQK